MFKITLFLHIISAIFWIGGMLFLSVVVAPFLRTLEGAQRQKIYQAVGLKFRLWGWLALATLVITGLFNLYYLGVPPALLFEPSFHSTPYGRTALAKISFVVLVIITSLLHDFWLGPGAGRHERYSRLAMILGRGNLLLALIIALIAVLLRAGA